MCKCMSFLEWPGWRKCLLTDVSLQDCGFSTDNMGSYILFWTFLNISLITTATCNTLDYILCLICNSGFAGNLTLKFGVPCLLAIPRTCLVSPGFSHFFLSGVDLLGPLNLGGYRGLVFVI